MVGLATALIGLLSKRTFLRLNESGNTEIPAAKEAMQQGNFKINKIVFETKGLLKKPLV